MKEITKVVTVQETYIDTLPDDSVEMIEEDVMNFKKYCEKRWIAESTADDVVANVQLFIRDLDEKVKETVEMKREQHIAERKTGKWKPLVTLNGNERSYCCSNENCGRRVAYEVVSGLGGLPNYCPWCGAKMEVDE